MKQFDELTSQKIDDALNKNKLVLYSVSEDKIFILAPENYAGANSLNESYIFLDIDQNLAYLNWLNKNSINYTKLMFKDEYKITKIMSEKRIAPSILNVKIINPDTYEVTMVKYPMTLDKFYEQHKDINMFNNKYNDKIIKLIDQIHKENIIHADLHGENIVINPETNEIRIIDFGSSYFFNPKKRDKVFIKPLLSMGSISYYETKTDRRQMN